MKAAHTTLLAIFALTVAGCGEKPQTAGTAKKADSKGYELANSIHVADGWKGGGDKASWEAQLRARALRGQDEYPRSVAPAAAVPLAAPAPGSASAAAAGTVPSAASAAPLPKTP